MIKDATNFINEKLGKVLSVSKIYESDPWRVDGQQNYLNQILEVNSLLSPKESLKTILSIENELGRVRIEKWGNV